MQGRRRRVFLITGANGGLGLEATRQILQDHEQNSDDSVTMIYLLCRSESKAAMSNLLLPLQNQVNHDILRYIHFDAYDPGTIDKMDIPETHIAGLLLIAGGFGDSAKANTPIEATGASTVAQLNIVAHAQLVCRLQEKGQIGSGTRIVAAGSEGCFASPGVTLDYAKADMVGHLSGNPKVISRLPGMGYNWSKGILALYWAAWAQQHPDIFVVTVSPGSVTSTDFYQQGGATPVLAFFGKALSACLGSRTVEQGAQRFTDALLNTPGFQGCSSGSFLAHRQGFAKDYGDVTEIKRGAVFGHETIQRRAFEAVETFLR